MNYQKIGEQNMLEESVEKPTKEEISRYTLIAASQLGVEPEKIQVDFWKEIFPNSAGPIRKKGVVAAQAFWYYGILGFKSSATNKKLKYCYKTNTWEHWDGVAGKGTWDRDKEPF